MRFWTSLGISEGDLAAFTVIKFFVDRKNTKNLLAKSKDNSIQTSEKDEQILGYCYYKERTLREIASLLNIEPSSYLRNEIIGNLINNNLL